MSSWAWAWMDAICSFIGEPWIAETGAGGKGLIPGGSLGLRAGKTRVSFQA
jgi:hypothetical protein